MIRLIEALDFRCLRYVRQPLGPFHVLVGPNASGKTTFLDVLVFLGQLVNDGLEAAVSERTQNFHDLVWNRRGDRFELAVEATIPDELRRLLAQPTWDTIRYEASLGVDVETEEISILAEKALLREAVVEAPLQPALFPFPVEAPESILTSQGPGRRTIVHKVKGGNDNFYSEVYQEPGKGWAVAFRLGPRRSALGSLPEDESKFPVTTWFKRMLTTNLQRLVLNSQVIRKASPPGQSRSFRADGSNLPWVVDSLQKKDDESLRRWIAQLRKVLPDLENVRTVERADDRHRYLILEFVGGLQVPSWMASDGTLRLMALTLPGYLPDLSGVYLVEEPENGIHPRAIATVLESLPSARGAQMLLATQSPVVLGVVQPEHVLCFSKNAEGAISIVRGSEHPALLQWRGEKNLGVLFADGVFG